MKILRNHTGIEHAELEFVVESEDVGKTFICEAGMIRYSLGGGTMSGISLEGPGVRIGYKNISKEIECWRCHGTGTLTEVKKKKVGLFRKRDIPIETKRTCSRCEGSGKEIITQQIPLEDGEVISCE